MKADELSSWSSVLGLSFAHRRDAPALSIVVPAYNERENIRPLTAAIARAMGEVAWELIIVDNDSPDGTASESPRWQGRGHQTAVSGVSDDAGSPLPSSRACSRRRASWSQ